MSRIFAPTVAVVVAGVLAGCAGVSIATPGQTWQTATGPVYTYSAGMTLYTFDEDPPGVSVCDGLCAVAWPPALAPKGARPVGAFTVIARDDGSRQWAYKGRPLYGYIRDSEPGDIKGDGVDGVWRAAKP